MAIVYIHKKKNGEVFYVGIGADESRAYSRDSRNRWWRYITAKYEYEVEITHRDVIREEACGIEKYLISFYGRRNRGQGTLCNLTDGGDGNFGYIPSKESRKKTSSSLKGIKRTKEEICKTMRTKELRGSYKKISKKTKRINIVTGEEIVFNTLTKASTMTGVPRSTIHLTLTNKTNKNGDKIYAGGFDWQYL